MDKPSRSALSIASGPDMADAGPVCCTPMESPANDAPVPNTRLLLLMSCQLEHLTRRCGKALHLKGRLDAHAPVQPDVGSEAMVCALACQESVAIDVYNMDMSRVYTLDGVETLEMTTKTEPFWVT